MLGRRPRWELCPRYYLLLAKWVAKNWTIRYYKPLNASGGMLGERDATKNAPGAYGMPISLVIHLVPLALYWAGVA